MQIGTTRFAYTCKSHADGKVRVIVKHTMQAAKKSRARHLRLGDTVSPIETKRTNASFA